MPHGHEKMKPMYARAAEFAFIAERVVTSVALRCLKVTIARGTLPISLLTNAAQDGN
jgi:hypothetical protein